MKVVVISAAFPPMRSGGADFVQRLSKELASKGVTVEVITSVGAQSTDNSFKLHPIVDEWSWGALGKCVELVESIKPDIVDIVFTGWMYHDHPAVTFLATFVRWIRHDVRVVVHIESLGGVDKSRNSFPITITRALASLLVGRSNISFDYGSLLRDSDAVIMLSQRDKNELTKTHKELSEKSVVIPPPPIMPVCDKLNSEERNSLRTQLGFSEADFVLSFYGYIYPGKGIELLFEAARDLIAGGNKIKLLIIGDTPEQYVLERSNRPDYLTELKDLASKLKIESHVVWTGYAPYGSEQPSRNLRLSDACVLPFKDGIIMHNSSFWFVAAHALPVVSTRGQNTEPEFKDGENILLCPAGDTEALAHTIIRIMAEGELRSNLSANAEVLTNSSFSWEQCIEQTIEVYKGLPVTSQA